MYSISTLLKNFMEKYSIDPKKIVIKMKKINKKIYYKFIIFNINYFKLNYLKKV
jgi:hypothetical protein